MSHSGSTILYVRKSTESDDRQVLSIDAQIDELVSYAARAGLIITRIYRESQSAKAPGRPVFGQVMKEVAAGRVCILLCWKLDRLSRNPIDGAALIWALEQGKLAQIATPHYSFANNANEKFWMQMEFGMAKKFVDDLPENVKRGIRAKLKQGWLPGKAPLGYRNDRVRKIVVPDRKRFALIRSLWDRLLTGQYSVADVYLRITEDHSHQGESALPLPLSRSALYQLFRNPFYCGQLRNKCELFQGRHRPMVTESEFRKVQDLLRPPRATVRVRHAFTYQGLLRCGECGGAITAEHKTNRHGHHYIYYHCTRKRKLIPCRQRVIEERELERQLVDWFSSPAATAVTTMTGRKFNSLTLAEKRNELLNFKLPILLLDRQLHIQATPNVAVPPLRAQILQPENFAKTSQPGSAFSLGSEMFEAKA